MSLTSPYDWVEKLNELSERERDLIAGGNAMRLLKISKS
jgi:hypothetical protein